MKVHHPPRGQNGFLIGVAEVAEDLGNALHTLGGRQLVHCLCHAADAQTRPADHILVVVFQQLAEQGLVHGFGHKLLPGFLIHQRDEVCHLDALGQIHLGTVNQQRQADGHIPQQPDDLLALFLLLLQLFEQVVLFGALPLGLVGNPVCLFVFLARQSLMVDVDFGFLFGGFLPAELVRQGMEQLHIVLVHDDAGVLLVRPIHRQSRS